MRKVQVLLEELSKGVHRERLNEIYVDESQLEYQTKRYIDALEKYRSLFGEEEVEIYSAPGRSEIGGNHTDHQHGKVLAAAINMDVIAIVGKTEDSYVELVSEGYGTLKIGLDDLERREEEKESTKSLIKGVAEGMKKNGHIIGGFKGYITGDVLTGSGLSSSAAFEVLIGTIFSGVYNNMEISPVEIAKIAQYAENVYFGKPSGLMDQMASSVGGLIYIDFKDPKEPIIEKVEAFFEAYEHSLCIVDTKGSHADLTDDYAAVTREMKAVAKYFGKEVLREVDEKDFMDSIADIKEQFGDRAIIRSMHFFADNAKVIKEVEALRCGRFNEFLKLVQASGNSSFKYLQNVYATHDAQNQGIPLGLAVSEKFLGDYGAARVHGGGFAGTIQAFVPNNMVEKYKETLEKVFGDGSCNVLKIRRDGGIKVI